MPPKGPRLTEGEVKRIKQWIDAGAKWPERDDYWAFQPPKEQEPPSVKNPKGIRNPIDLFIKARLEAARILPAPPADARKKVHAPTDARRRVRIAHLDTGYDPNHSQRPVGLRRDLARNFLAGSTP